MNSKVFFSYNIYYMSDTIILIVLAIPILALSIAAHEMMHALISYKLGDDTAKHMGRISLNPMKHIDPLLTVVLPLFLILIEVPPIGAAKPVIFNPNRIKYEEFGVAMVAIAGPLTNLLLALLFGILLSFTVDGSFFEIIAELGLYINTGFFIFNMIPYPPLDGSRILYAFAPEPIQRLMRSIESLGMVGFLMFFFVLFPLIRPVVINLNNSLISLFT